MTRFFPSLCLFPIMFGSPWVYLLHSSTSFSIESSITRPSPKWLVHFLLMMPSYSFFLSSMNRPVPLFIVLFLYDSSPSSVTHHLPLELIAFLRDTSLSSMTRPFSSVTNQRPLWLAPFFYHWSLACITSLFFILLACFPVLLIVLPKVRLDEWWRGAASLVGTGRADTRTSRLWLHVHACLAQPQECLYHRHVRVQVRS